MVDLKAKPFYLGEEQIQWVEDTVAGMSEDEKIGQLFINLTLQRDEDSLNRLCNEYHIGGARWQGGSLEDAYNQNRSFQQKSRIMR